jgi:hypothetical protein
MDNQIIDVFITKQQMLALGQQLNIPYSKLSPFNDDTPDQSSKSFGRVLNPQVVTPEGNLHAELAPAFQVLANPQAFASIGYAGRSVYLERGVYFPQADSGQDGVSLASLGEGFQLQSPPTMDSVIETLYELFGGMILKYGDIDMDIPFLELWMLFAAVDAGRRIVLEQMLKTSDSDQPLALTLEEINAALIASQSGSQWLAPYFAECLSLIRPTEQEVATGLMKLIERKLLVTSGGKIQFSEQLEQMVYNFLVTDGHLRLRSAYLDQDGEIINTDFRAIQGRAGAIVLWSYDTDSAFISSVSPAQLITILGRAVSNPKAFIDGEDRQFEAPIQQKYQTPPSSPERM